MTLGYSSPQIANTENTRGAGQNRLDPKPQTSEPVNLEQGPSMCISTNAPDTMDMKTRLPEPLLQ